MRIEINKKRKIPLYIQIAGQIKRKIISGELVYGSMLPSERGLAGELGVHRNTVIRAYTELRSMNLIKAEKGKGYIVKFDFGGKYKKNNIPIQKVNWDHLIKDQYLDMEVLYDDIYNRFAKGKGISLSTGVAPFIYTEDEIIEDLISIIKENSLIPAYIADYQGDEVLIKEVQTYLRNKGMAVKTGELQILQETNQALDFILNALVEPGDSVIVEEPCSPDVFRMLELAGCNVITIPVEKDGMEIASIEAIISEKLPKFIYINSSFHDPTGNVMSVKKRRELLELSDKYGVPIVEDDAASELYYEEQAIPTLKSLDTNNNVIYIYSFALTFVPGISLAIVAADEKLINAMSYLVSVHILSVSWMYQRLIAKALSSGRYLKKCKEMIRHNRKNRDIMCRSMEILKRVGARYTKPKGGVYIWLELPLGLSGRMVAEEGLKQGVAVVPGDVFFTNKKSGREFLRLNYSYESSEWLKEGTERLVRIILKMTKETELVP